MTPWARLACTCTEGWRCGSGAWRFGCPVRALACVCALLLDAQPMMAQALRMRLLWGG
jgi:hypothetical protein